MKKIVVFISSALIACITMISCSKNNDPVYYETFGVIQEDIVGGGKMHIASDLGKIIIPVNSVLSLNDKGSRVWMLFTVDNSIEADTIKASIYELLKITQIEVQTDGLENLKNDKIMDMKKIWVKQNFLTFNMLVYAYSPSSLEKHKYNLYLNPETTNDDTIYLELRYDNNSDQNNREYNKLVTIPMSQIFRAAGRDKASTLSIKYMHKDGYKTMNVKIDTE